MGTFSKTPFQTPQTPHPAFSARSAGICQVGLVSPGCLRESSMLFDLAPGSPVTSDNGGATAAMVALFCPVAVLVPRLGAVFRHRPRRSGSSRSAAGALDGPGCAWGTAKHPVCCVSALSSGIAWGPARASGGHSGSRFDHGATPLYESYHQPVLAGGTRELGFWLYGV